MPIFQVLKNIFKVATKYFYYVMFEMSFQQFQIAKKPETQRLPFTLL